ncbi:MAG: Fic family protein [Armatimonadota bacterium]|nr:Fic family protein [bacterium]
MGKLNYISGMKKQKYQYQSFMPSLIDKPFDWEDRRINMLLEEANRYLGELNAYSTLIPDVDFFIHMHIMKEATKSSRIEGTQTAIEEAVVSEEEVLPERRDDWKEIQNYTKAMNYAIDRLTHLPLSVRLLQETHGILLDSVRGEHKNPGEIRKSQNWIGGSSIADAFFIPPHHDDLPELLSDLEKFWHNDRLDIPELVKIAISHYQFETIHPFLDGNGRIGRLLVALHLISKGVLGKPTLYLSDFFEKNKASYYDSLTMVRHTSDMQQWIRFFLSGVKNVAQSSKDTLKQIVALRMETEQKLLDTGKRIHKCQELLKFLYSNPIVTSKDIQKRLSITHPTANELINVFTNRGILSELDLPIRSRAFGYMEYLNLFN